ncbi:hypothetical protein CcCBS67573_g08987 [Chytriomyces confervae]|uniref:PHD-type domain-containing protein n=1 Tax=Chytriomyces confervae TaxID=246404 RepID=A0A507EB83_9FUNG|nr:hypothetical protein CcCBS67573_g08987 [Chytriomyces confervae]
MGPKQPIDSDDFDGDADVDGEGDGEEVEVDNDNEQDKQDADNEMDAEMEAGVEVKNTPGRRGRKPGKAKPTKAKRLVEELEGDDGALSDEDYSVPVDKEGEAKMSADGELLGGRVFKVRTFKLARHPTKLYMLTLDVARALGFRDSYLLHLKNPQIRRLFATDEDKQRLEAMDLLASNFRSRPLGIMSTRTVFKHFGYSMLVRGKPVRDDYVCTGKVEPENWVYPEDENDRMSGAGSDDEDRGIGDDRYKKGGSNIKRPIDSISYYEPIYRAPPALLNGLGLAGLTGGVAAPALNVVVMIEPSAIPASSTADASHGKLSLAPEVASSNSHPASQIPSRNGNNSQESETAASSTEPIPSENATDISSSAMQVVSNPRSEAQMLKAAASAAEFNSRLRAQRRRGRFLDIHTNVEQVAQLGQPSHVLIEKQLGGQEKGMVLEVSFGDIKSKPASSELEDWMAIKRSQDAAHYPISIMPGQYQAAYSVHRTRFEQSVAPIKSNESFFVDFTGKPLLAAEAPNPYQQQQVQQPMTANTPGAPVNVQNVRPVGTPGAMPVGNQSAGVAVNRPPQLAQQRQTPVQVPGARVSNTPALAGSGAAASSSSGSGSGTPGGAGEHYNQPGFIPHGMTAEQWQIMKPKLSYSQLKELREQAPVVSMGPSGKYSVRFTCGYLTRAGAYCQKPVMEAGLICLFHQKLRAQEMASQQQQQQQQQQQMAAVAAAAASGMTMPGMSMMANMNMQGMNMAMNSGMMMPNMMGGMMQGSPNPMQYQMMAQNQMSPSPMMFNGQTMPVVQQAPVPPTPTARMVPVPKQVSVIKQLNTNPNASPGGKKSKASNLQDMECAICHGTDPPDDEFDPNPPSVLLRCAECGLGHHLTCADITTPVMVSKVLMPGAKWKCGNCKMCEVCNKAGEDETLMVLCDACDKGYHTYCLNPKMDKAPSGSWHCPGCRICISCNSSATTMDWRHVSVPPSHEDTAITGKIEIYACTYCAPCHKRFLADQFCPLCFHVYKEELEDIAMACCDVCDRWIHVGCDPELSEARYKKLDALGAKYTCVLCTEGASKVNALIQRLDKTNRSAKPSKLMMYHGKYLVVPPLMKRPPEKT